MSESIISTPKIGSIRIDLSADSDFTKKGWGRRVNALPGGRFSEARGSASYRFVNLPPTPEGLALACELVARFGYYKRTTCVIEYRISMDSEDWGGFRACAPMHVFEIKSSNGKGSYEAWDAALQLAAVLERHEAMAQRWWREEGAPAAEKKRERDAAEKRRWAAAAPKAVADQIRSALAIGADPIALRAAIEEAMATAERKVAS